MARHYFGTDGIRGKVSWQSFLGLICTPRPVSFTRHIKGLQSFR